MDINLLTVSIGNSRIAVAAFVGGELERESIRRVSIDDRAAWPDAIAQAWKLISDAAEPMIVGASVNPTLIEAFEHTVEKTTGQAIQWIGDEIEVPIKSRTDNAKQTGVDRLLTAAAAFEQMGKACVIVDAGTAVTVNCVNDAGEFLGGAIAPGIRLQLLALQQNTAKLPAVEFEKPSSLVAANTVEAMRQGVYHGIRGLVKEVVENYATELGNWPDLIATGGDAPILFEGWELVHAIAPDLLLYGIALAATEHQIKRDA